MTVYSLYIMATERYSRMLKKQWNIIFITHFWKEFSIGGTSQPRDESSTEFRHWGIVVKKTGDKWWIQLNVI